jgi:hypothetical protein
MSERNTPKPPAEMERLIDLLEGRWSTTATHEPSEAMPQGGVGEGEETSHAGPGRFSVIFEDVSEGPSGRFEGAGVITWAPDQGGFRLRWLTNADPAPGEFVGQWRDGAVVFEGEETVMGARLASRHTITDIKPDRLRYLVEMGPTQAELRRTLTLDYVRQDALVG